MSDKRIRDLQRKAVAGDLEAQAAVVREQQRAGLLARECAANLCRKGADRPTVTTGPTGPRAGGSLRAPRCLTG